jgi:hypothetical protein
LFTCIPRGKNYAVPGIERRIVQKPLFAVM